MYSHHIQEMEKAVSRELGIKDEIQKLKMRVALKRYWCDKLAISWTAHDVIARAKAIGKGRISKDLAIRILDEVQHQHDASIGVNWTTIDNAIIDLVK